MTTGRDPIWMVPRRPDPGFVGREAELAALAAALASAGRSALTQPTSVHGLGGVGKTLLAVEYASRHEADYDTVLWVAAEDPASLASAFADLAGTLGLPEASERDQSLRIAAVRRWMESNARWLLVFDNAERHQDIEPYLPVRLKGHVLITSRNPDWQPLARPVAVRPLPRRDSIALLRGDEGLGSEPEADRLADALGDLPLALAQAAAYVRATACSFAEYLERFRAQDAALENEAWAEPGYGRTVAATLEVALAALRTPGQDDPGPAEVLLAHCAFYAPEAIPRELLAADFPDAAALDTAVRTLRSYSLVETAPGTLSIHRLVQRAVRSRMPVEQQKSSAGSAVEAVYGLFPREPWATWTWPESERLLAHAIHATDLAVGLRVATESTAGLLNLVGIHLWSKHNLPRAREQFTTALKLKETAYRLDNPLVSRTLTNLGVVARDEGDLVEARRCQERALRINEVAYGPDHPEVAIILANLGNVARDEGDLVQARLCQERALRINEATHGPDHPEVAIALANLGNVAQDEGDLVEARRCQERALQAFEIAYGPDHPEVATTLTYLGAIAWEEGDLVEARRCQERALAAFRKHLGEEHPYTTNARNNLGLLNEPTSKPAPEPAPRPPTPGPVIETRVGKAPSALLSYSWDDDEHREWVKQLAIRLTVDGVAVTLDLWHAAPGGQIPAFMERAVRENDFVITICTPKFKEKSDRRGGGVGYEGDIMTAEVFTGVAREKFIPVLRRGSWTDAAPSWLRGSYYIDLSATPYSKAHYEDPLRTIHGARESAPQPGPRPDFGPRPSALVKGTTPNP